MLYAHFAYGRMTLELNRRTGGTEFLNVLLRVIMEDQSLHPRCVSSMFFHTSSAGSLYLAASAASSLPGNKYFHIHGYMLVAMLVGETFDSGRYFEVCRVTDCEFSPF